MIFDFLVFYLIEPTSPLSYPPSLIPALSLQPPPTPRHF